MLVYVGEQSLHIVPLIVSLRKGLSSHSLISVVCQFGVKATYL